MADVFSKRKRSAVMAAIRSKDTGPEKTVRSMLHHLGLRFRLHDRRLPGTPDVILNRHRTVVEVFGCFFHRHPGCRLASNPASNRRFWREKFRRNVARDAENRKALQGTGWRTVVVWECELRKPERLERRLRRAFGLGSSNKTQV
jgi:DNA mismatch endonuclease (patch repair protein)